MEAEERVQSQEDGSAVEEPLVLQHDWQTTSDSRGVINGLLKRNKRKTFGLLEKPLFDPTGREFPVLFRKLFLVGKSGVGKTATVHKLMGRDIPASHEETLGIQTSTLYWPVKVSATQKTVVVKLELWDTGEKAMAQYDHIMSTCKQSTDGILFFFSYTDRHSWETLPQLFTSVLGSLPTPDSFNVVIGTHADCPNREVTKNEVERFQNRYRIFTLPSSNINARRHSTDPKAPDGRAGIHDITLLVNAIVEILLAYEKRKSIMSGVVNETRLSVMDSLLSTLSPADTETPSQ